jgi:hypothetical protein
MGANNQLVESELKRLKGEVNAGENKDLKPPQRQRSPRKRGGGGGGAKA